METSILACLSACVSARVAVHENKTLHQYRLCCGRPLWFRKWIDPAPFLSFSDEDAVLHFQILLFQTCEWANGTPVHLLNYLIKFPEPGESPEDLCEDFVLACGLGEADILDLPLDCALWIEKVLP